MHTKVGLICEAFDNFASLDEKMWKIGNNTGNILFLNGLYKVVECEIVSGWDFVALHNRDALITTELVWIQQGVTPSRNSRYWLENLQCPLIPLSVGLQANQFQPDFCITPEMQRLLSAIQERATIGVRGAYTASILEKHKITNIEIIGCPSVYQIPLFRDDLDFLFTPRTKFRTTANYKTFTTELGALDRSLMNYIARWSDSFTEQTLDRLQDTPLRDAPFVDWVSRNRNLFFDIESWVRHNSRYDFSFGLRFHGNLAAILAGARALFVTSDSRTQEMTDYFCFPALSEAEIDTSKPLNYFFDKADYSKFRAHYKSNMETFFGVLNRNGLPIRTRYKEKLAAFRF